MERAHAKHWVRATVTRITIFTTGAMVFVFALAALPPETAAESVGKSWWTVAVIGMAAMCLLILGVHRRSRRESEEIAFAIEEQVLIARPIEEVFAFLADVRNDARWSPQIVETVQASPGAVGLGTTYRHVMRVMGREIETDWTVTVYQPPHQLAMDGTVGKQRQRGSHTLASVPGGTIVSTISEMPSNPLSLPLHPLYRSLFRPQVRATLTRLKRVLDGQESR